MIDPKSEPESWLVIEKSFDPAHAALYETLFALGNGYIGMRGSFEEGLGNKMEGTFVNGFYESAPIIYGEKFIGFAENKQTILNLPNARLIRLSFEGETLDLRQGKILAYRRELDLKAGVLLRYFDWESPQGRQVRIESQRLVLQTHKHLALIRYRVTPLNFSGKMELFSGIDGAVRQSEHAEDDPRLGTQFKGDVFQLLDQGVNDNAAFMVHQTLTTHFKVVSAIRNHLDVPYSSEMVEETQLIGRRYRLQGKIGETFTLEKIIAYVTVQEEAEEIGFLEKLEEAAVGELAVAAEIGFAALMDEQRRYMEDYWQSADIVIEGDETLQRGIRFNLFHLLQGTGRDGRTNIAAKGLTGLGYEGHYFWDTEVYILPFFLYTRPDIGRKLLEYRYHILDQARQRAREMSHRHGALYSWRTINGAECSANFPTGTAQYHINADIAFAIQRYFDATQDEEFMIRFGAEILCETARLWLDVGDFIAGKGGRFCIHGVTGPDEYQILVNNNAYTNLMARENLRNAHQVLKWMRLVSPAAYSSLVQKIALGENEPEAWQEAAEKMYLPYDEERGLIAQDDAFLDKPVWDFAGTPKENYPLLLHYHPLVVTRYQVCKQADALLAEFLLHDQFDQAQKRRDFTYYEPLTTHDSSLSGAIFGILAAELGDTYKAYRYFSETATLDLENKHGNTQAGIHAANMAGAWQGIVFGFAGLRAHDGLSFSPRLPKQWRAYSFKVRYRGSLLGVQVAQSGAIFTRLQGPPLTIWVGGRAVTCDTSVTFPLA